MTTGNGVNSRIIILFKDTTTTDRGNQIYPLIFRHILFISFRRRGEFMGGHLGRWLAR